MRVWKPIKKQDLRYSNWRAGQDNDAVRERQRGRQTVHWCIV